MRYFRIGDVDFGFDENEYRVLSGQFFEPFYIKTEAIGQGQEIVRYRSRFCDLEELCKDRLLKHDDFYELFNTEKGQMLIYHWMNCRYAYGMLVDDLEKNEDIICCFDYRMEELNPLPMERFFSCVGLHSKLLQRRAAVLHASYIDWKGRAILFMGVSGTGKSTQADLWNRYAGAEIINGDRALVRRRESIWHAYGYPCCGSSNICLNRTLPVRAIVKLEQGTENEVIPMSLNEKIRSLLSGTEVYRWNMKEIDRALELVQRLAAEVLMVRLICRPDEDAVAVLRKYLED